MKIMTVILFKTHKTTESFYNKVLFSPSVFLQPKLRFAHHNALKEPMTFIPIQCKSFTAKDWLLRSNFCIVQFLF